MQAIEHPVHGRFVPFGPVWKSILFGTWLFQKENGYESKTYAIPRHGGRAGAVRPGGHAVELRFEPGSDPDTAARKAFADWDAALARLPSDGQYAAEIAMVEAEGGYYIAVDVKIVKAGKPDTDDDDEEVGDGAQHNESANAGAVAGMNYGTISNCDVTIEAGVKISASESTGTSSYVFAGAVAGENYNSISGCKVTIESGGSISATSTGGNAYAGGVAGYNKSGTISGCTVTVSDSISATITGLSGSSYAGGVAGYNKSGTVSGSCKLNDGKIEAKVGENTATITEDDKDGTDTDGSAYAGTKIGYDSEARRPAT